MNVTNEPRGVLEIFGGYPVTQNYNRKLKRWYVWLPTNSGLREMFGRERMLRSHYVWCRVNGLCEIPHGYVIHHKDHDRCNDAFTNLLLMTESDHDAYHATPEGRKGFRRGWDAGAKHKPETIELLRQIASKRGNNDVWNGPKKEHFEATKRAMGEKASGGKNAMYRHDLDNEAIRRCYAQIGALEPVARIFGCSIQAVRNRVMTQTTADWKSLTDEQLMLALQENGGSIHRASLALAAPTTSLWRRVRKIQESQRA